MIPIRNIRSYWGAVAPFLYKLLEKNPDLEWMPEDIFMAATLGTAQVWLAPDGVLVIRATEKDFTREPVLFVWAAYSTNGDALIRYEPEVNQIAHAMGAHIIQFMSSREGMSRKINSLPGWTLKSSLYEKEVT